MLKLKQFADAGMDSCIKLKFVYIQRFVVKSIIFHSSELFYDRGNHHEFTSLVKELVKPGDMTTNGSYKFDFVNVEKPYESYTGKDVRLR